MTPSTVPSTFPGHRLCNADHRIFSFLSFSLSCNGFPRHAFLAFSLKSKITRRHVRHRCFKHCGNIEQSSALSWFLRNQRRHRGPDRWWAPCHRPRNDLFELFELINYVRTGLGQVAKLLGARADAFDSDKSRRRRCGRERDDEVSLREQQRWGMKRESGESEMEIFDMHTDATCTLQTPWTMHCSSRKENVRATRECVYKLQSRLSQYHHGAWLCLCTSAIWVPTQYFLRCVLKWTFFLSLCASVSTEAFAWTCDIGMNLRTKL